uniref:ATP synthase F0 subunit 8 n=1 Tax=Labidocera rotunda TaxID=207950 RepID=UPI002036ADE5|nr:ATP synthase F0 subunit 8 [Labidocera rotunda]URC16612.1 ATP synthase F0 subunit 8 [Labidocera rotunda]
MPQMNPMNWLLLLVFFNSVLMMTGVKIHFLYKEVSLESSDSTTEYSSQPMIHKI